MSGITTRQREVLAYLVDNSPATSRQINDHLCVVGRQRAYLDQLAQLGHVTRTLGEDGTLYEITRMGRHTLAANDDRTAPPPPPTRAARSESLRQSTGDWAPTPWRPEVALPGCMDHCNVPSLQGSRRVYRSDAQEPSA